MTVSRFLIRSRFVVTSLFCVLPVDTFTNNKANKKADIQKMSRDTLHRLYKAEPPAKVAVEKAYGYAVFSNISGNGIGMAVNNKTKGKTFMRMFEIHEGSGAGVRKFRYVFVFDNEKVFNDSVNSGWESGGKVSAGASNGVWMYQLSGKGVVLNVTVRSAKYSPDDDLNESS